jgi:hypothetical protein
MAIALVGDRGVSLSAILCDRLGSTVTFTQLLTFYGF